MGAKGHGGWPALATPPVSPDSAHVTPCGRPMHTPYLPISWTDGQQSPRSKGPTGHAPVTYSGGRLGGRSGSIKSHFAGSHDSPLTAADDVPVSTWHSLSASLSASLCLSVCVPLLFSPPLSPRVFFYTLCWAHTLYSVYDEGRANNRASMSGTNHGHTSITNAN